MSGRGAYSHFAPMKDSPILLWIGLQILQPGDRGLGDRPDVEALYVLEDRIVERATAQGMRYVGRLRNAGDWQLSFYGAPRHEGLLGGLAVEALAGQDRGYRKGRRIDERSVRP
jgi:uncharacterized protein DUF695